MNDTRFWEMIEAAWDFAPQAKRRGTDAFLAKMAGCLGELSRKALVEFDDALSRWMYALDSEKLAKLTNTGDDGFADARAYTIALGRAHCTAVLESPERYADGHLESFLYLPGEVHERRFSESLPRRTISRATASNPDGWPRVGARLARDLRRNAMRAELRKIWYAVSDGTPFVAPPEIALEVRNELELAVFRFEGLDIEEARELGAVIKEWQVRRSGRNAPPAQQE